MKTGDQGGVEESFLSMVPVMRIDITRFIPMTFSELALVRKMDDTLARRVNRSMESDTNGWFLNCSAL
jgi:hypothetical protein